MELYLLIDYIGVYAPIILFFLTILILRNKPKYLHFFVYGFILNNILNIILKLAIKEPRPSKDKKAIEIGIVNGARVGFDNFGMPSGHAQNCGYNLIFITMVLNDPLITTLYLVISLISLFQRYLYNNHSFLQLIVGLIVGSCFGFLTYIFATRYIVGNVTMKKDDNAPL